jgi:hypothetical protein
MNGANTEVMYQDATGTGYVAWINNWRGASSTAKHVVGAINMRTH